ncbi:MAG TPA: SUMF1/EgtB/PvdO family nonheme iron enzyme [Nevskiaceae bacterium]|nr:SUMF1/EgtB/PvdO family nonheme iron enzyme [Nevskiaceae bacterium]
MSRRAGALGLALLLAAAPLAADERPPRRPQYAFTRCMPPAEPPPPREAAAQRFRDCANTPELRLLPGGRFVMGEAVLDNDPYARPLREVQVAAFAIGQTEVTVAEWLDCVHAGGCSRDVALAGDEDLPINGVSWYDAQEFVSWLSRRTRQRYRLPSEAEWEYAARAGRGGLYPWETQGDGAACRHANLLDLSARRVYPQFHWYTLCDDGYPALAPVGRFPANAWGLHDVHGNVWEWVQDCWQADYREAPDTAQARESRGCHKRVNRGGGWGNGVRSLRLAMRDADPPDSRSSGLGFRVARDWSPRP